MKVVYQLVLISLLVGALCSVARAELLHTVALTGDHAPGMRYGHRFTHFITNSSNRNTGPVLNPSGQVAFSAYTESGEFIDFGIWSEGSGSVNLVAGSNDPVPGAPAGARFRLPSLLDFRISLSSAGQTAFYTGLGNNGLKDAGIWSESFGLVALEQDQAPDTPEGANFSAFDFGIPLNSAGHIAFLAHLTGTGVDSANRVGIWSDAAGSLSLVARTGDPAPGTSDGAKFHSLSPQVGGITLNSAGHTAFRATLKDSGDDGSIIGSGIWMGGPGSLELLARTGEQVPGMPEGVNFSSFSVLGGTFSVPALNSADESAFATSLNGSAIDDSNDSGVWTNGSSTPRIVAREGDPAPGTPIGVDFAEFSPPLLTPTVLLNSAGKTAFLASLTGTGVDSTNRVGIWSEGSGQLALVARTGDHAPGTPNGEYFLNFLHESISPVLNAAGQTAFQALLVGNGIDDTNDLGIWAEDRMGTLRLIAREGELLEVAPGDLRTIESLDFVGGSGNDDGRSSGFNDLGQLAFAASFTDGTSGIFVSNLATLPEPSCLLLAFAFTLLLQRNALTCLR